MGFAFNNNKDQTYLFYILIITFLLQYSQDVQRA